MVHLNVRSWFSFLCGASSPKVLAQTAAALGQSTLALTDMNTLAGAVQFAQACRKAGIKPIFGATVEVDNHPLVLLCANRDGYANLCDLLTLAHHDRLQPHLTLSQFADHADGLVCLTGDRWGHLATLMRQQQWQPAQEFLRKLHALFGESRFVELTHHRRPGDTAMMSALVELAQACQVPVVATNAVAYARPRHYALHDALTCARLGLTISDPHPLRPVNFQACLRSERGMRRTGFPDEALDNSDLIADWCNVSLLPDAVTPPQALLPAGVSASDYLWQLCRDALNDKFPCDKFPAAKPIRRAQPQAQAQATLRREMDVICELGLEEFFLVVREVVQFARSRGIRCSGRGSAANSLVVYLLGITNVDPIRHHLLFERFLHTGRKGMPDIDVDFATDRRHEVIAWMSQRFGDAHTAMTANVVTFRLRMAVREMAKVLGFPLFLIDRLAKVLPHASARHVRLHRKEIAGILGESPSWNRFCVWSNGCMSVRVICRCTVAG